VTPRRDAIRVVPLYLPSGPSARAAGIPAPPAPRLTYRGGPLLERCEVFLIFWGSAWEAGAPKKLTTRLEKFFQFILASPLMYQLSEYDVPGHAIGHGRVLGHTSIASPAPGPSLNDSAIRSMLTQHIASGALPPSTADRLYFVYLPPGTAVVQGGARSCQAFCGYHDAISDPTHGDMFYAAMPYPGCAGCRGGLSAFAALTSTSSHELCEAITDPVPGQGWYDDVHGEIGDICAWKTKKVGAYIVQQEWSNQANRCL
jgi:hypothetical protein